MFSLSIALNIYFPITLSLFLSLNALVHGKCIVKKDCKSIVKKKSDLFSGSSHWMNNKRSGVIHLQIQMLANIYIFFSFFTLFLLLSLLDVVCIDQKINTIEEAN